MSGFASSSTTFSHNVLSSSRTRGNPHLEALFLSRSADTCQPDQGLFWEGDPASVLYQVVSGTVRVFRITVDGRRGITAFLFPGDMFGFSLAGTSCCSAEAVVESRVKRLPRERLEDLMMNAPDLRREYWLAASNELSAAQEQLLMLSQKVAEERVATLLLLIARKIGRSLGGNIEIEIHMSRRDMADYLGLTVETVCRVMTKLKNLRYISLIGRRTIILQRPSELVQFAADDDMAFPAPAMESRRALPMFVPVPR